MLINIELTRLKNIDTRLLVDLMNNPQVRRQMPLTFDNFSEQDCNDFISAKEALWNEYGYGPWAFLIDGQFAGWGGLQPEAGDADIALVLHPAFWGCGKTLFSQNVQYAFSEMALDSITALLPPSRTRIKGLSRLGFERDGELQIGDQAFHRFRLHQETWQHNSLGGRNQ